MRLSHLLAFPALTLAALPAAAQEPLRIGLIYTLSGPSATLGEQARNGFRLAVEQKGGTLGGVPVELFEADDEQKPDVAVTRVRELLDREGVDIVVGPIFANVLMAIHKPVLDSGRFLISTNAGVSPLAGKDCHPHYFATSYQTDQIFEALGEHANRAGYTNVFVLTPNYQGGKDAAAGFKRRYEGAVAGEAYTPLGQLDFGAELAQIAALQPDAVFTFMPGGMGVNLIKQYRLAGLDAIPLISGFTVDEANLPAQQDAAVGMRATSNWAPDLDAAGNAEFVAAYEATHGTVPGTYAMQAYDAALLLDSALAANGGSMDDADAFRAAMEAADFPSLRGEFRFGPNHYPVQDFYLTEVVRREDGKFATSIVEKVLDDYADAYVSECRMAP